MADLTDLAASQSVKIIGATATANGLETTPVAATTNGGLHANLRNDSGAEAGIAINPIRITNINENASIFSYFKRVTLAAATVAYYTSAVAQRAYIHKLRFGGRVLGEVQFGKYTAATTLVAGAGTGVFNSSANVAAWTNTGIGDSTLTSWSYTTAQSTEGTGSAIFTFTKSSSTDYPELTYTYSTPIDASMWRYISAQVRATVAVGGSTSRTVQVRLTSGTAVRIYSITGTTTTAPFATEQWQNILVEIESPSSTAGTGSFDSTSVNSISLRLQDGANRIGSVYWDDVKFIGMIENLEKIYTRDSVEITFDPAQVFESGESILFGIRNNDTVTGELNASVRGIKP